MHENTHKLRFQHFLKVYSFLDNTMLISQFVISPLFKLGHLRQQHTCVFLSLHMYAVQYPHISPLNQIPQMYHIYI